MRLIDGDKLMATIRQHDYRLATQNNSIDDGMFTLGIQQAVDEQDTMQIGNAVDTLFSHNEIIALWHEKPEVKHRSYLLWRGMAWNIPKEYKSLRLIKFFGTVPEKISEADTINILVTPYITPACETDTQVFVCSDCGKPICEGDTYYDYLGEQLCRECLVKHIKVAKKEE